MPVPLKHLQPPRELPGLKRMPYVTWARVRQIGLDSNGNDTNGVYFGRGEDNAPFLLEWRHPATGEIISQSFWGPAHPRLELLRFLHRYLPRATIEVAPYIALEFSPNFDHAAEDWISFSSPKPEPKAETPAAVVAEPLRLSRSERWRRIMAKRKPKPPSAKVWADKLDARLKELRGDDN